MFAHKDATKETFADINFKVYRETEKLRGDNLKYGQAIFSKYPNTCDYNQTDEGEERIICEGGKGGRGNWHFKSSTNQTPRYALKQMHGFPHINDISMKGNRNNFFVFLSIFHSFNQALERVPAEII